MGGAAAAPAEEKLALLGKERIQKLLDDMSWEHCDDALENHWPATGEAVCASDSIGNPRNGKTRQPVCRWPSPPKLSRAKYRQVRRDWKGKNTPPKTIPFVTFKKEVSVKMEKDVFDLNNPHDVMAEAQRRIDCPKVWKRVGEEYKPKPVKLVCKAFGEYVKVRFAKKRVSMDAMASDLLPGSSSTSKELAEFVKKYLAYGRRRFFTVAKPKMAVTKKASG